ncbi:MAG: Beta-galactoside-specific lectin 3 [Frankiales bacterium]|nr:Beta-galactoside-specific lectin 3 [Frankiales bacterium]
MMRLQRLVAARRLATGDDGMAMVLAILLILLVAGLSLSMGALVIAQSRPTQFNRKNAATVNAASTGLQVGLDRLRAANDGAGNGSLLLLPCTGANDATLAPNGTSGTAPGVTYTGPVSSLPGALTYRVSISYYTADPSGKDLGWLQSNAKPCPLLVVPTFAYVEALGAGAAVPGEPANRGNRGVHATYTFNAVNTNVTGGRLKQFPGSWASPQLCVDAGSATPAPGTQLLMQPCLALGTPQQTFQYRTDLTLYFGGNTALNLCAEQSGGYIKLQTCTSPVNTPQASTYNTSTGTYLAGQQVQEFAFDDNGHFAGASSNGGVTGTCMQPEGITTTTSPGANAKVAFFACTGSTQSPGAWDPDPDVGAGKAGGNTTGMPGSPTNQFVNYSEFGRCLDITGQNVNNSLIAYPCKQAPNSSTLTYNQVWNYVPYGSTGYGQFYTVGVTGQGNSVTGTKYCLKAPSTGNLILTPVCAATPTDDQLWKATGNTNVYATAYRLISKASVVADANNPYCMSVGPIASGVTPGSSDIITQLCDGSLAQKWNAPPNPQKAGLGNLIEQQGGGS